MKFQILPDSRGGYFWRLTVANGAIVAYSGESYSTKDGCLSALELVRAGVQAAAIEDRTG